MILVNVLIFVIFSLLLVAKYDKAIAVISVWSFFLNMLASGLPTVATRVGDIPELATPATTVFVENDHGIEESLREAILGLRRSADKRREMSEAAVEELVSN